MDLNLSDEQQQLVDSFGALYAKDSPPERVRAAEAAEPTGHDPELWLRLLENGAVEMAVDEASGGWGASLLDLALVAEQHGRYLGAAPLIEAQVAARLLGRLLGRLGPDSRAAGLLEPVLAGAPPGDPGAPPALGCGARPGAGGRGGRRRDLFRRGRPAAHRAGRAGRVGRAGRAGG